MSISEHYRSRNRFFDFLEFLFRNLALGVAAFGDFQCRFTPILRPLPLARTGWAKVSSQKRASTNENGNQHDEHHQKWENPHTTHPEGVPVFHGIHFVTSCRLPLPNWAIVLVLTSFSASVWGFRPCRWNPCSPHHPSSSASSSSSSAGVLASSPASASSLNRARGTLQSL